MRREFSKQTKRDALKRSGTFCEAVGAMYGLKPAQRCNAPLGYGVEFDHVILDANSKDNSLENCAAVCVRCHKFKTRHHDIPVAAKTVRQQDMALGIKKAGRGWWRPPNTKWDWKLGRMKHEQQWLAKRLAADPFNRIIALATGDNHECNWQASTARTGAVSGDGSARNSIRYVRLRKRH